LELSEDNAGSRGQDTGIGIAGGVVVDLRADVLTILASLAAAARLQLLVTLEGLPSEPEPEAPTMTGDNQFHTSFSFS